MDYIKQVWANIDKDGAYCLILALRFGTTGPKIANKIERKLISVLQFTITSYC